MSSGGSAASSVRLAAAWLRSEPSSAASSPLVSIRINARRTPRGARRCGGRSPGLRSRRAGSAVSAGWWIGRRVECPRGSDRLRFDRSLPPRGSARVAARLSGRPSSYACHTGTPPLAMGPRVAEKHGYDVPEGSSSSRSGSPK